MDFYKGPAGWHTVRRVQRVLDKRFPFVEFLTDHSRMHDNLAPVTRLPTNRIENVFDVAVNMA